MTTRVVSATPEQAESIRDAAAKFELYAQQVSAAVARRYVFAHEILAMVEAAGITLSAAAQPMLDANRAADASAQQWAEVISALNHGRAELAAWSDDEHGTLHLGVVKAGSLPTTMQAWPIIPVLVLAAGAVMTIGVWMLADAWLSAGQIEAEANKVDALNRQAVNAMVAQANAAGGPDAAKQLADAIERAQKASSQTEPMGFLDKLAASLGAGVKAATGGFGELFSNPLVLFGIGYWLSKRSGR